jgi:F-box protein 9
MSAGTSDILIPDQEPAELARFREQWKAEVRERQAATTSGAQIEPVTGASLSTAAARAISPARSDASVRPATLTNSLSASRRPATYVVADASTVTTHASHGQSHLSPNLARAVEVYRKAVFHEQHSQLDEALRLYRQAFRLDANVDRAYFIEEQRAQERTVVQPVSHWHKKVPSTVSVDGVTRDVQKLEVHKDKSFVTSGFLAQVLKNFPENLVFEPEDEKEGLPPINLIPDELLLQILRILDYTTIERFAAVSRKARVLSLDSAIWRYSACLLHVLCIINICNRDFVQLAYKPPQIADDESIANVVELYSSDYRRAYIEHPRLRLDGVYIAVCHYM